MKKYFLLLLTSLVLLGLIACNNSEAKGGLVNSNATINVSESSKIELFDLDLEEVTFTSSDENIVRVDETGVFIGLEPGSTTIVVKKGDREWIFNVIVQGAYLNIDLVDSDVEININETHEIDVTTNDKNGLEFNSLNKDIATVNEQGVIEGVSAGETSIIISSATNPNLKRTLNITVIDTRDPLLVEFENSINNTNNLTNYTLEFSVVELIDGVNYYHTITLEFSDNLTKLKAGHIEEYYELVDENQYRYYQTVDGFTKEEIENSSYEPFLIYEDFTFEDFSYNEASKKYSLNPSSGNILADFIDLFGEDGVILLFEMSLNEGYIEKMSFLLNFSGIAFDVEIEIKNIDETIVEVPNYV